MSLQDARLPSLRDKIEEIEKAETAESPLKNEAKKKVEVELKVKGKKNAK